MMNEEELIIKINELEEFLDFVIRYQLPFSDGGFRFLCEELKNLKITLATIEADKRAYEHKLTTNN